MVEKYTLKNGIPLFVVEMDASPVVSIQAWVGRGSAHESDSVAGISHFLEHALFKGTKRREVGEIALEIERCGGEVNAFTSFEETVYYTTLASRFFDEGLDVITDAIQNPLFDKQEMDREREVILEEIKRAHDSPAKIVSMNLWRSSFKNTPYGRPVLGYPDTVKKIGSTSLRKYFEKNYHNETISLVIVGDIDKNEAFSKAQKKLSKVRKGQGNRKKPNFRAPQLSGMPIQTVGRDLQDVHFQIGFRGPGITDATIPSTDIMCSAIGSGESSLLYQRLVKEKHVALDSEMGLIATDQFGLATLDLVAPPDHVESALEECVAMLSHLQQEGLDSRDVERVKSGMESEIVYGKETVGGYARRLGYYYRHFGDPEYETRYLNEALSVDVDQAQHALHRVLSQKPVVSIVHPTQFKIDKKFVAATLGKLKPNKKRSQTQKKKHLPEKTQKSGITFIFRRLDTVPTIATRIIFPGGTTQESPKEYGLSHLFQRVWGSGTAHFSSIQIARKLESMGASLNAFCGRNTFGLSMEFLTKHWPQMEPLVADVLLNPAFPESEVETEKHLQLRDILAETDSPTNVCQLNFQKTLYKDHPYGRSTIGTTETVQTFQRTQLIDFYEKYVNRGAPIISTVGQFHPERWIHNLEAICNQLPEKGAHIETKFPLQSPTTTTVVTADKQPLFQTHILVGFRGASFDSPSRFPLKLLSSCLSGQGGRLFLELRDKQSLAYTVAPIATDGPYAGIFAFYIGCSPEKWQTALSGIRAEIEKLLQKPISRAELSRAKQYWLGRFEMDMQRYGSQALLFGLDEHYGMGYRHSLETPNLIKSITAAQIQEAAQNHLQLDKTVISIVHPTKLAEDEVKVAWANKKE